MILDNNNFTKKSKSHCVVHTVVNILYEFNILMEPIFAVNFDNYTITTTLHKKRALLHTLYQVKFFASKHTIFNAQSIYIGIKENIID